MTKMMLIDAAHPEETRVMVTQNGRIEEFDFESSSRKQIRANIYLAKVTRVEPALQAAFVEYGGNRHGFLAFNEIHPDYYQIPFEDRQALIEEAKAEDAEAGEDDGDLDGDDDDAGARSSRAFMRRYKIQEVIKRRQILLVQVAKEERGNKGAALTTYLSLAGRYCVLMPNTARGGGISRKITNATDRKRLRKIADELEVPDGVGLIVRTAGAKRTKTELKRDYDYLLRLWETIRNNTLTSIAPCLIHEESNLVKRSIRDLYDKDVEEILVQGDASYREAKDFIKMLMPSNSKKVQKFKGDEPIFTSFKVEDKLEAMYDPEVTLPSGGYLVINQTEALVAIDVNSGKSTRERNVEATALKTNLEAAAEACRQFRLRDLAGLIVIDFIDMEEAKNNRAVEKKMRDCLKNDRARIQVGKISGFGLLELSRQRRRASIIEGSHVECKTCGGRGTVRTPASSALHVLRRIEQALLKGKAQEIEVRAAPDVIFYVLNEKRRQLVELETRYDGVVRFVGDAELVPPTVDIRTLSAREGASASQESEEPKEAEAQPSRADGDEDGGSRRRRRGRRNGRDRTKADTGEVALEVEEADVAEETAANGADEAGDGDEDAKPKRRRRRGRRGGRGRSANATEAPAEAVVGETEASGDADDAAEPTAPAGMEVIALDEQEPVATFDAAAASVDDADLDAEPASADDTDTATTDTDDADAVPSEGADAPSPEPGVDEPEPAEPVDAAPEPAVSHALNGALDTATSNGSAHLDGAADVDDLASAPVGVTVDPAQMAPAEPDPDAESRRKRWQDRLRSWVSG